MALGEGFHRNLEPEIYHADPCADPSLSSSIAKILANETPAHAWVAHTRLNPNFEAPDEKKFDLGTVAHELLLGKGAGFLVLDFQDWRSKAAQEARQAAIDCGKTPILAKDAKRAGAMEKAATKLLLAQDIDLSKNENEGVIVWREGEIFCRSMIDSWDRSQIVYDVKTTDISLSDAAIMRQIVNMGYDLSAGFYLRGLEKTFPELAGKLRFKWIFIETTEPYEVRVIEASGMTLELGARKADFAIRKWQHCMATGEWPGYARKPKTLDYPAWAEAQWLERELEDAMA